MIKIYKRMIALMFAATAVITVIQPFVGDLSGVLAKPKLTPQEFLDLRPYSTLQNGMIIIEPSSSLLVFALAIIAFVIGILFLVKHKNQISRRLWGWGMIFWGISAASAGISYQCFGYELKARGQEYVLYTSWFEIIYMILAFASIAFLLAAEGYVVYKDNNRRMKLNLFCTAYTLFYTLIMCAGVFTRSRTLMSYNVFLIFNIVTFAILFSLAVIHYIKYKDKTNRNMIIIGVGMVIVNILYFVYLFAGTGQMLWDRFNIYFTSNDVLHVALIVWMLLQAMLLYKPLADAELK